MATGSALSKPPDGPDGLPQVLDLFPRGPEGDAASGGVRPPGVEAGEDSQDTGGPGGPPKPPKASTKPWRKSWRRRWRRGSTYRDLSHFQKAVLQYIEDNADDNGSLLIGQEQFAEFLSSPREVVVRTTLQYALEVLARKGLIEFVSESVSGPMRQKTRITRVNFREYQDPKNESVSDSVTESVSLTNIRGKADRVAKATPAPKKRERPKDPVLDALFDAMRNQYIAIMAEAPDWVGSSYGDIKAVRKAIGDDAELMRRWRAFLSDQKFWPIKSPNRFRAAHTSYAKPKSRPLTLRPVPGIDTDE